MLSRKDLNQEDIKNPLIVTVRGFDNWDLR